MKEKIVELIAAVIMVPLMWVLPILCIYLVDKDDK